MTSHALASRTVSPGVVDATIDRYVTGSCARIDRLLAQATLAEPVIKDADRAVKAMEPLIETLTGLAIGRVIGAVIQGVRRTFEPATSARVELAMASALRAVAPPQVPPLFALDDSPCRAFANEVRQRLRRRISLAPRDARHVIAAMARALESHDAGAFVRLLSLLADDPMLGERFEPQIAIAWRCYAAVVEGTPCEPGDALWGRWLRKVRGEREPVPSPSREQLAAVGVIAQIQ